MGYTNDIIKLNRDVEPLIVQGATTRTSFFNSKFNDKFKPLQFVHFSDVHAVLDLWNRIVDFINYYSDYIDFAIHTGDFCGSQQELYVNFYMYGNKCKRLIYNCIGNHDTYTTNKWIQNTKESTHRLLFAPCTSNYDLNFLGCDYSMTYYKDFADANIRLIVLDLYYDIELQCSWLKDILTEARQKGMCVITAMHEPSDFVNDTFGVTFHTRNDYVALNGRQEKTAFEPIIADFVNQGGCHVCNLVGHEHHDLFGLTDAGILNTAVPCATDWDGWCDGKRVKGTHTYDCFNVVSVDTNLGLLRIARVGNNRDNFFRSQRSLCFDYRNKKVIYND